MESKSKLKSTSLAILIPMFNEEAVAGICIEKVIKNIKNLPFPVKLILVNDGSTDNTAEILKEKERKYKQYLHVSTHSENKGYGAALQTGIHVANKYHFQWILHMDSDLTNDPVYIHDFAKYMNSPYDCIKASRYIEGGIVKNVPLFRQVISIIGNSLASMLFHIGIKDCTNGFRMVRLSLLKGVTFKENNFSIILEELLYLKQKHAKFTEIPYTLTARINSKSHFSYKPKIIFDYFKYAFHATFS